MTAPADMKRVFLIREWKMMCMNAPMKPSVVMVECKEKKIPTSMVNAFVDPVGKSGDLVVQSVRKLADEVDMIARNFGLEVKERLWFCVDKYDIKPETATKVCATFPELVESVSASL